MELTLLDAASSRIDEEIQALCTQRALLRRRVNTLRDKSFKLPPETLTAIFECAICENVHSPLHLGAVCSRWRRVVWESPSLWSSIFLSPKQSGVGKLLSLHLENSKGLAVSIHLPTKHDFLTPIHPLLSLTRDVFTKCPAKTRVLNIGPIDNNIWSIVASHSVYTGFPHLETIKLTFGQDFDPVLEGRLFCRTPLLRSIEMTRPLPGIGHCLPLHKLTSLSLQKLSPPYSLYFLSQCPNLVEFHSQDPLPYVSTSELSFTLEASVTLHNLRSLRWEGDIPLSATFITDIHLPSIQEVFWQGHLDTATRHSWQPFFSVMERMNTLDCSYTAGIVDLLDSIPSVENIHVRFDHLFDQLEEVAELMSHLDWEKNVGILPYLTQLSLTLEEKDRVMSKEILPFEDTLIQMVRSRSSVDRSSACALHRLSLTIDVLVVWGTWYRHLAEEMSQLSDESFVVTVT